MKQTHNHKLSDMFPYKIIKLKEYQSETIDELCQSLNLDREEFFFLNDFLTKSDKVPSNKVKNSDKGHLVTNPYFYGFKREI